MPPREGADTDDQDHHCGFGRSSPRSLLAGILDALRQTASRANAEEEAIAPSSSRRRSGRARTSRAMDPEIRSAILACPLSLQ